VAVVVTAEFLHEAEMQRAAPVVIDHPLSTISESEIDARAAQAAEQAERRWTAGEADA